MLTSLALPLHMDSKATSVIHQVSICMWVSFSGFLILFLWSTWDKDILITIFMINLNKRVSLFTSGFFGSILASLCPLLFHIYIYILNQPDRFHQKVCWNFYLSCIESIDQLDKNWHLYNIKSSQLWKKFSFYLFRSSLRLLISLRNFFTKVLGCFFFGCSHKWHI